MKRVNKANYRMLITLLIITLFAISGAYALLSDKVTLEGSATVKEADYVSLEISEVSFRDAFSEGGGVDYTPSYSISESKDSFSVDFGSVRVDQNGKICGVDGETRGGVANKLGATFTVTVTNKGNKPVVLSTTESGTGMGFMFVNYSEGFTIDEEVLEAGASCTFTIVCKTTEETYTDGYKMTAEFSITGTEYTGEETPRETHVHEPEWLI